MSEQSEIVAAVIMVLFMSLTIIFLGLCKEDVERQKRQRARRRRSNRHHTKLDRLRSHTDAQGESLPDPVPLHVIDPPRSPAQGCQCEIDTPNCSTNLARQDQNHERR